MVKLPLPVIEAIRQSQHLLVLTGAGVSVESGIPAFRGSNSAGPDSPGQAEMASAAAFREDPAAVWAWYERRLQNVAAALPNAAHTAIAALSGLVPQLTLITQNVDDLHERAGSPTVVHLHGTLSASRCSICNQPFKWGDSQRPGETQVPPRCLACNAAVRPGVVWFGEALPEREERIAFRAVRDCDCLISVGTSGLVQPAASLPRLALLAGATVIHINTERIALKGPKEYALRGNAGELLPLLIRQAFPECFMAS